MDLHFAQVVLIVSYSFHASKLSACLSRRQSRGVNSNVQDLSSFQTELRSQSASPSYSATVSEASGFRCEMAGTRSEDRVSEPYVVSNLPQ